jgi:hypothetical protein
MASANIARLAGQKGCHSRKKRECGRMTSTALITGAARGIGKEFAFQLAVQQYALILVDRLAPELENVAKDIRSAYCVPVEILVADLSSRDQLQLVCSKIEEIPNLELLVNSAGTSQGSTGDSEINPILTLIHVNVVAPTLLCRSAICSMKQRKRGAIINVASLGGIVPYFVGEHYGASKSYVITLSKLLNNKNRKSGIHVQALCPGLTETDIVTAQSRQSTPKLFWMAADAVVAASLKSLHSKKSIVFPGAFNTLVVLIHRLGLLSVFIKSLRIMTRIGLLKTYKKADHG